MGHKRDKSNVLLCKKNKQKQMVMKSLRSETIAEL